MFVWHRRMNHRGRVRIPPALFGFAALLAIGVATMAQVKEAAPAVPPVVNTNMPANNAAPANAGTPVVAPTDAADKPTEKADPNVWELFRKGGMVMWILAASSVIALAIIFERIYMLRRNAVIPPGFIGGLKGIYLNPETDREKALAYCRDNDSPMSRMVGAFIKRLPRGFEAAEKAVEDAGGNEALRLRANLRIFYAIGSVATLLGLIGTIAGMIRAFMATAKATEGTNKVETLSTGIYEAMVCTFGGLAVAILVTIFYYYFIGRVEKLVTEINDELTRFADDYGLMPESADELATTSALPKL